MSHKRIQKKGVSFGKNTKTRKTSINLDTDIAKVIEEKSITPPAKPVAVLIHDDATATTNNRPSVVPSIKYPYSFYFPDASYNRMIIPL